MNSIKVESNIIYSYCSINQIKMYYKKNLNEYIYEKCNILELFLPSVNKYL